MGTYSHVPIVHSEWMPTVKFSIVAWKSTGRVKSYFVPNMLPFAILIICDVKWSHNTNDWWLFRPHRSTTYVDAAYCYRPSSVVCRSVCLSVCCTSEPCKTAAPIDMLFGLRTVVGPRNSVLVGGPDLPREGAILRGKGASHCKV